MTIDIELQTQIDTQILEQGAFAPLEFLIDAGRLIHGDYEGWRRREIGSLDNVLMGSKEKIRAQLESAAGYARSIGLVEQPQTFYAWVSGAVEHSDVPLRISADAQLHRLIGTRYVPAQNAPQMDLFFDNPVVALTNGIVRALSARNLGEAQRQLVKEATEIVAKISGDPSQAGRTWVLLTEAAEGGWGIAGTAFGREEFAALAAKSRRS